MYTSSAALRAVHMHLARSERCRLDNPRPYSGNVRSAGESVVLAEINRGVEGARRSGESNSVAACKPARNLSRDTASVTYDYNAFRITEVDGSITADPSKVKYNKRRVNPITQS